MKFKLFKFNKTDNNELKKLTREKLVEIILKQQIEIREMKMQIDSLENDIKSKKIAIEESGNLAEASMKLTRVFEEAQKAADIYIANIKENYGE